METMGVNVIDALPVVFVLYSEHYQYIIKDVLGRGTCGIVYLAEMFSTKDKTSSEVALKEWVPEGYCQRMQDMSISYKNSWESKSSIERFTEEYKVLSTICHHNVVTVFDYLNTNGTYYYSMEYLTGGTLLDKLVCSKLFNEEQSTFFIKQIAAGLEAFHQKHYIHTDLQLKNIAFRSDDCIVLIDGGEDCSWRYNESQDIWALANVLLCMLSGELDAHSIYTQSESMFALAKEKGNMTENTEKALRMAFSAEFQHVEDFVSALEGHFEPNTKEEQCPQLTNKDNATNENDSQKALDFLGDMEKTNNFYISRKCFELSGVKRDDRAEFSTNYYCTGIRINSNYSFCCWNITNRFFSIQKGFVLSLRLPSPNEFIKYMESHDVKSSVYLTYDSQSVEFFTISVKKSVFPWLKKKVKVEKLKQEHQIEDIIQNCKFFYVCDRNPLIADSHRLFSLDQTTQMTFDTIMPASPFGFCRVAKNGKWGMVSMTRKVSLEIECKYDSIDDLSVISIPGPGPGSPLFVGTVGCIGERTDFYELRSNKELHLKESMTKAQIVECSRLT